MSKIEDAIRKASLDQENVRRRGPGKDSSKDDTQSRLALVLYRLEASRKHVPDNAALERNRIIHDGYSDEALTNYKMLRTRILQEFTANEWKTLAITAPHDGAGKTVNAINLAIALASHGGHEVYLVDLDMRNPSIADYFDLPADIPGLAAYLDRRAELESVLWDVGVENLVVLANRDRLPDSSERITSKRMQELIESFKSASSKPIVIFDLPPVLTADDAVAIAPSVDAMLMIVAEGETQRDDLAQGLDLLRGANVLGVVLNKSDSA
jgi:capsular exopolysaccharide synthesis family protein